MGKYTALLCMLLLTRSTALRYQFKPSAIPDSFIDHPNDFYDYSLSSIPGFSPTNEWTVSAWAYIKSAQQPTLMSLLHVVNNGSVNCLLFINSSNEFALICPSYWPTISAEALPFNTWIHLIMGSTTSEIFGVLTKRSGAQYLVTGTIPFEVTANSKFHGASLTTITVRST